MSEITENPGATQDKNERHASKIAKKKAARDKLAKGFASVKLRRLLLFLAATLSALTVQTLRISAMEFELREGADFPWVFANGNIETGDASKFFSLFHDEEGLSLVVLNSDGGSVFEAIELGRHFRSLGFDTLVPTSARCFSACFLTMIGGNNRFVSTKGAIGFHQFKGNLDGESGEEVESNSQSVASAIIEYVSEMGIDVMTLAQGLKTPPNQMYVFSESELDSMGINSRTTFSALEAPAEDACPFPKDHKVKDPLGLYPGCKNRE